jgi:hypothetical protein
MIVRTTLTVSSTDEPGALIQELSDFGEAPQSGQFGDGECGEECYDE